PVFGSLNVFPANVNWRPMGEAGAKGVAVKLFSVWNSDINSGEPATRGLSRKINPSLAFACVLRLCPLARLYQVPSGGILISIPRKVDARAILSADKISS